MHEPPAAPEVTPLPAEVTSFVGRRAERHAIREQLAESRLLTLTGFGGVGKTRLAVKVASELRRAFEHGVAFVPLDSQNDPDSVAFAISSSLGLQGRSRRATTTAVVEYLQDRSILLVLDNCEHLVDSVAVLTDTLLKTCADLRILATSREPLRIDGEAVHPVSPLSVPARCGPDPLQESEAVRLLLDRARSLLGDFDLTEDNREAVASIVSKLEGIPLAIELAAGRLKSMTPPELAADLTEQWQLLTRGSRSAPSRQQTMAACIEWSFALCDASEQELWGRLAVFSGGFEIDAAREVAGSLGADAGPVDDILLALVDKSIVLATTTEGRTRFRMLPPLRQRGLSHLQQTGELADMRQRHRDWYVAYAARVAREWMGPEQVEHIHRLRREMGNLQAALEFCGSSPEQVEPGLRMGADLLEFGMAEGVFREGGRWFDRLLSHNVEPTESRARALRTACWWAAMKGDLAHAGELLEEGRALAAGYGGRAQVLLTQASAYLAMFSGDHAGATAQFEEALAGFIEHDDRSQAAHTHTLMALNHVFAGDLDRALAAHEACLAVTEPAGEEWFRSYSMWIAGIALWAGGRADEAERMQKESLRFKRRTADRLGIGTSVEALAWIYAPSKPEHAARLLGAAQRIWDHIDTSTEALPGLHVHHLQCVDTCSAALGERRWRELFDQGRALEPAAALELAVQDEIPRPHDEAGVARPRRAAGLSPVPSGGPVRLTKRESQIAELVAQGMSNKDIASHLVISKRTAETHVDHILTKLGFTNRHQIAAWVHEQKAGAGTR